MYVNTYLSQFIFFEHTHTHTLSYYNNVPPPPPPPPHTFFFFYNFTPPPPARSISLSLISWYNKHDACREVFFVRISEEILFWFYWRPSYLMCKVQCVQITKTPPKLYCMCTLTSLEHGDELRKESMEMVNFLKSIMWRRRSISHAVRLYKLLFIRCLNLFPFTTF